MKTYISNIKALCCTLAVLLTLNACSKNQGEITSASVEESVLLQSPFHPGEKSPGADEALPVADSGAARVASAVTGGDGGFIGGPGVPTGGDHGTVGVPGTGTTSGTTTTGGTTGGTTTSGGTSSTGSTSSGSGQTSGTTSGSSSGTTSGGTTSSGSAGGSDTGVIGNNTGGSTTPNDGGVVNGGGTVSGNDGGTAGGVVSGTSGSGTTTSGSGTTASNGSTGGTTGSGSSTSSSGTVDPNTSGGNAGGNTSGNTSGSTTVGGNDNGGIPTSGGTSSGSDTGGVATGGTSGTGSASNGGSSSGSGSASNGGTTSGTGSASNGGTTSGTGSTSNGSSGSSSSGTVASNSGGNHGGLPSTGGTDTGSTQPGNNGVGNGIDPQPPGNPPVNDGSGTSPGHPGNSNGGTNANQGNQNSGGNGQANQNNGGNSNQAGNSNGGNCGNQANQNSGGNSGDCTCNCDCKRNTKIVLSRVCSVRRSALKDFIFFEDAKNRILTLEATIPKEMEHKCVAKQTQDPRYASIGFASLPPRKVNNVSYPSIEDSSKMRYLVAHWDLSQVDLFKGKYTAELNYSMKKLKEEFGKDWKKMKITVNVCEDDNRNGFCGDEKSQNLLTVSAPSFTAKNVPRTILVDVWHGRYKTRAGNPDLCEKQYSPIVLDLTGAGINLIGPESGVRFDLNATGSPLWTGWVKSQTAGFLVRDLNGNGSIDSGAELFGNATVLSNGVRAINGFEAMKDLDSNHDGILDRKDTAWSQLRVWVDKNVDGESDRGELYSLDRLKIESFNLNYVEMMEVDDFGNQTRQRSTFRRIINGVSKPLQMIDVWFNTFGE